MIKPLTLQIPFPSTEDIACDAYSLRIISPAYASPQSELNAILQYVYHSFFFSKNGYTEIGDTLMSIAVAEMTHLDILGETILALGAAPVFAQYPSTGFNFYSAKYVSYSCTLKNMLEDDIHGEKHAIAAYKKMLTCLRNEQIKAIISRIIEDEELHLKTLEEILKNFNC